MQNEYLFVLSGLVSCYTVSEQQNVDELNELNQIEYAENDLNAQRIYAKPRCNLIEFGFEVK